MFTSFKGPWAPCLSFNSFMTLTSHCEFDLISIRESVTEAWRTSHIPRRLPLLPE